MAEQLRIKPANLVAYVVPVTSASGDGAAPSVAPPMAKGPDDVPSASAPAAATASGGEASADGAKPPSPSKKDPQLWVQVALPCLWRRPSPPSVPRPGVARWPRCAGTTPPPCLHPLGTPTWESAPPAPWLLPATGLPRSLAC